MSGTTLIQQTANQLYSEIKTDLGDIKLFANKLNFNHCIKLKKVILGEQELYPLNLILVHAYKY